MYKKIILSIFLSICILFMSANLRADDDSIMDADNNSASFTGTWTLTTAQPTFYGNNWRYTKGSGSATRTAEATFKTANNADITGTYHVFARWTSKSDRYTAAVYRIYSGSSYQGTCYLNQTVKGGEWVFCKEVKLTAGQQGIVKLGNENCPTDKYIIADAVRFVRVSKDDYDIVDEAGIDYIESGSMSITSISSNSSACTNVRSVSVTAPSSGYILVTASGIAELTTADRWVKVGLSNVSGGSAFSGLTPFLENTADEKNAGDYEDERRFALQEVFYVSSAGTKTFYLKACREAGATGRLFWNDLVAIFFPTRY